MTRIVDKILCTEGVDGDARTWGICETCGHVEELSPKRVAYWMLTGLCEGCEDSSFEAALAKKWDREDVACHEKS